MTQQEATITVEVLSALGYYPPAPAARMIIADALMEMCPTGQDAMWLVRRACQLHQEWPRCGIKGLWQIWFSKHAPRNEQERALDLMVGSTEAYPEGVPSERPQIAAAGMKQFGAPQDPEAAQMLEKLTREVPSL